MNPSPSRPLRRALALVSAVLVSVLANACSGPGGRRYPILGLGWVTVPTNPPTSDAAIGIRGAVVSGLVVGTAGPWTGLVLGRAEMLTIEAATNAAAWAEGTLSGDGFGFRVVPLPASPSSVKSISQEP